MNRGQYLIEKERDMGSPEILMVIVRGDSYSKDAILSLLKVRAPGS